MKVNLKQFQMALKKIYKIFSQDKFFYYSDEEKKKRKRKKRKKESNTIQLTVLPDSSNLIISATYKNGAYLFPPLSVFITIGHIENPEPINFELSAELLCPAIAKFRGNDIYIEKEKDQEGRLLFDTKEEERTYISLNYINLGPTEHLDDKSDQKYIGELHPEMFSQYLKETKHALELREGGRDIRYFSFYFEADANSNIRVTTTNSHRISIRYGAIENVQYSYVLPKRELIKATMVLGDDMTIKVPADGDYIQMVKDNITAIIPVCGRTFFGTLRIIDRGKDKKILTMTVHRERLLNICKAPRNPYQALSLKTEGNILWLSFSDKKHEGFNFEKTIPIKRDLYDKDVSFSICAKYLCDALRYLPSYEVEIMVCDSLCIITKNEKWDGWGKKPPVSPIKAIEAVGIIPR